MNPWTLDVPIQNVNNKGKVHTDLNIHLNEDSSLSLTEPLQDIFLYVCCHWRLYERITELDIPLLSGGFDFYQVYIMKINLP